MSSGLSQIIAISAVPCNGSLVPTSHAAQRIAYVMAGLNENDGHDQAGIMQRVTNHNWHAQSQ